MPTKKQPEEPESMSTVNHILQKDDEASQSSSKRTPPNSPNHDSRIMQYAVSILPNPIMSVDGDNHQLGHVICKVCGSRFVQPNSFMQHLKSQCNQGIKN